jgi:hypothetical protein
LARLTPEQLKLSIVVDGALGICMWSFFFGFLDFIFCTHKNTE